MQMNQISSLIVQNVLTNYAATFYDFQTSSTNIKSLHKRQHTTSEEELIFFNSHNKFSAY